MTPPPSLGHPCRLNRDGGLPATAPMGEGKGSPWTRMWQRPRSGRIHHVDEVISLTTPMADEIVTAAVSTAAHTASPLTVTSAAAGGCAIRVASGPSRPCPPSRDSRRCGRDPRRLPPPADRHRRCGGRAPPAQFVFLADETSCQ